MTATYNATATDREGTIYIASVTGEKVTISERRKGDSNVMWAGDGLYQDGQIRDCPANLPEGVYEDLEEQLAECISSWNEAAEVSR